MKRIRLLVLLGVVAIALPLGLAHANAAGKSTTGNSVTIEEFADYDAAGFVLDVGLYVRCSGGTGFVDVTVEQNPPETVAPVAFGSGPQAVVCDGKTRRVGVTIVGEGFDAGRAEAEATLVAPPAPNVTAKRNITIVVV
jgi:hypothetical protein